MLRESTVHTDLSEMTMSMMREKQYEACERRLFAHPSAALFSAEATELDAQSLYEHSFDFRPGQQRLCSLDELRGIIDALADAGCRHVVISGGEPFLRDDLPAIVAYVRERGIASVDVLTSGTAVTPKRGPARVKPTEGPGRPSMNSVTRTPKARAAR